MRAQSATLNVSAVVHIANGWTGSRGGSRHPLGDPVDHRAPLCLFHRVLDVSGGVRRPWIRVSRPRVRPRRGSGALADGRLRADRPRERERAPRGDHRSSRDRRAADDDRRRDRSRRARGLRMQGDPEGPGARMGPPAPHLREGVPALSRRGQPRDRPRRDSRRRRGPVPRAAPPEPVVAHLSRRGLSIRVPGRTARVPLALGAATRGVAGSRSARSSKAGSAGIGRR